MYHFLIKRINWVKVQYIFFFFPLQSNRTWCFTPSSLLVLWGSKTSESPSSELVSGRAWAEHRTVLPGVAGWLWTTCFIWLWLEYFLFHLRKMRQCTGRPQFNCPRMHHHRISGVCQPNLTYGAFMPKGHQPWRLPMRLFTLFPRVHS